MMTHTTNKGLQVEELEDGENSIKFESSLDGLGFAEILFREARKSALLQQVAIVDDSDQEFRKIGYISAIERSTDDLVFFVSFAASGDAPRPYHLGQIELVQRYNSDDQ